MLVNVNENILDSTPSTKSPGIAWSQNVSDHFSQIGPFFGPDS